MANRKSTNINELPTLNSLVNQTDEDDAIAEVLEEIENENNSLNNSNMQPPLETMPQGPSINNIPTPMNHPMQNQQMQNQQMQNQQIQNQQMQNQQMQNQPIRIIPQNMHNIPSISNSSVNENSIQQNVLDQLKNHLLTENFIDNKQKTYDNRILKVIENFKENLSLILVIFVSHIALQNPTIKNILLSRFERINIPYLNIIILGITQILIVFIFKNIF